MNESPPTESQSSGSLRVDLAVRHPECWIIDVSSETDIGVLGRGVYRTSERRANSHVTVFGDRRSVLDEAIEVARASAHTAAVAEMTGSGEHTVPVAPGKASRKLLVEHDPTKQVSDAFTSRGFVYGAPVDIRDGVEHWTLFTHEDRHAIRTALDEVRDSAAAKVELVGISAADTRSGEGSLPLYRLSARQREVFQLARRRGYYTPPKETTASDLAEKLGVTTSTIHEHLRKAEQELLNLT
jgi:predicted DNA binding protein